MTREIVLVGLPIPGTLGLWRIPVLSSRRPDTNSGSMDDLAAAAAAVANDPDTDDDMELENRCGAVVTDTKATPREANTDHTWPRRMSTIFQ